MTHTLHTSAGVPHDDLAPASRELPLPPQVQHLLHRLDAAATTNIGFPAAVDANYASLGPTLRHLLNDVGGPDVDPTHPGHAKGFERDVVRFCADLLRAPAHCFGYVTTGGHEGNIYGLYVARNRHPDAVILHSRTAHYSITKAAHLLAMPTVAVPAQPNGEVDYDQLRRIAAAHRHRPIIVVATIGTTMSEAVDDVTRIHRILDDAGVADRYIHSDAALAGIPLALTDNRPGFDFADGADTVAISGHKFPGTPLPCGVVITRHAHPEHLARTISYTGSPDTTITGSRSGHAALMLWLGLHHFGRDGLRERTEHSRRLAAYACARLQHIGWPAWRNPHAMTVMLRALPPQVAARWPLATADGWSHIICMPGITYAQIDAFVADLAYTTTPAPRGSAGHRTGSTEPRRT